MTGEEDFDRAAAVLKERWPNIRLLNVTAGGDGSHSYYGGYQVFEPACKLGGVIETTGAGDTFCACVLNYVLEHGLDDLREENLHEMLRFANTAAYIPSTRRGSFSYRVLKSSGNQLRRAASQAIGTLGKFVMIPSTSHA